MWLRGFPESKKQDIFKVVKKEDGRSRHDQKNRSRRRPKEKTFLDVCLLGFQESKSKDKQEDGTRRHEKKKNSSATPKEKKSACQCKGMPSSCISPWS